MSNDQEEPSYLEDLKENWQDYLRGFFTIVWLIIVVLFWALVAISIVGAFIYLGWRGTAAAYSENPAFFWSTIVPVSSVIVIVVGLITKFLLWMDDE